MDQQAEKKEDKTERVKGLGRRTRGDRKVESNDSTEIPDMGETSDSPGLPPGVNGEDSWEKGFIQQQQQKKRKKERIKCSFSTLCVL